jgi:hypothetical protein
MAVENPAGVGAGICGFVGLWMVVCAARYEPVSTCNSLLSGKLTGNFTIFGLLEAKSVRKTPVPQRLLAKFPTQINRENILKNREFLSGNREFHLRGASVYFSNARFAISSARRQGA